jgi:Tfp pilus assembly protein PilX
MRRTPTHPGYIFLVTVLIIGAIVTTLTVSLLLLAVAAERNAFSSVQGSQAYANAQACVERALQSLRADLTYVGKEVVTFTQGDCQILPIAGNGNERRTICTEGRSGPNIRRFEVVVRRVLPVTLISSWKEVSAHVICPAGSAW